MRRSPEHGARSALALSAAYACAVACATATACATAPTPVPPELRAATFRASTLRAPAARADVHYVELDAGDAGTPLVFLHPWGADHDVWTDVAPQLAANRRAILVDLLGHGGSSHAPGRYPPRRLAQAVLAAMDHAHLPRAIVVGNSLGGATALAVAELAPERVAGLVLVGAAGAVDLPAPMRRAVDGALSPESLATVSPGVLRVLWRAVARGEGAPMDRLLARVEAQRLDRAWPAVAAAQASSLTAVIDYAAPLEAVRAPTLVVHGEDDRVVWGGWSRALAARIPGARAAELADCGHIPEVECPDALVAVVRPFVAAVP